MGYGAEHSETSGVTPLSLISTFGKIKRGALSLARVECELDLRPTHPLASVPPCEGYNLPTVSGGLGKVPGLIDMHSCGPPKKET